MHDRQRIREALKARLVSQVGTLVPGGIHAGRAGGLVASGELAAILVDVFRSKSEIFAEDSHAEEVTYVAEVALVADGPEPDLADGRPACCDILDDIALEVRRALKRGWALADGLALPGLDRPNRVVDFRFVDDVLVVQPGGQGAVAHLTNRFAVTVVCDDGNPASA